MQFIFRGFKRSRTFYLFFLLILPLTLTNCQGTTSKEDPRNKITQSELDPPNYPVPFPEFINDAPNHITRTIIQDQKGNIWFATFGGLIKYDGETFTNTSKGITQSRFFSALEDSKGNLWFGTIGGGVFLYQDESFQNFTTNDGLVDDKVTNIYEDSKGNIWFGTIGGASCYNGESFQNFTTEQGLDNNDVNFILEDHTGKFWFGTRGYACVYDGQTFTKIENEDGFPFGNIRHIIQDQQNNIWMGGNAGLWRINGEEFTQFTRDFTGYIYEDQEGNIWTSSESSIYPGWVLSRFEYTKEGHHPDSVTQVKTGEGMFFGILEDADGNIWSGTLNGVYRYDGKTFQDFK